MPSARSLSTPADSGAFITKIRRRKSFTSRIEGACFLVMRQSSFIGVLAVWVAACGGRVDLPVPEGGGGAGAMSGAGGRAGGAGGCPPLPTEPKYDCKPRPKQ